MVADVSPSRSTVILSARGTRSHATRVGLERCPFSISPCRVRTRGTLLSMSDHLSCLLSRRSRRRKLISEQVDQAAGTGSKGSTFIAVSA